MDPIDKLTRLAEQQTRRETTVRYRDADGRPFNLGGGGGQAPSFNRTADGEKPYSVTKIIRAITEQNPRLAPMELAVSDKLKEIGYASSFNGVQVPLGSDLIWCGPGNEQAGERLAVEIKQMFAERMGDGEDRYRSRMLRTKTMDPNNDALGGSLIDFPDQGQLVDYLRTTPVMSAAGAQQVALPTQGSLYFPRGLGDPTLTYLAPSAGIPESDARTGSVQLIAKRAAGLCRLPNDLVRYSGGTAEAFIRNALMSRARLTEDRAYLTGTGGSVEPLGLLNYDRSADKTPTQDKVTTYIAGAPTGTGDALLPEDILRILALIEESPDPDGANAWIMRPGLFAQLANARADAVSSGDGAGPFLYPITRGSLGAAVGRQMSGLPVIVSTQMPATRQKGGATNLSCIVVGNFSRAVIGRAGAMELATSPDYAFNSDELMIRIVVRSDFALLVPSSFAVIDTLVLS